jgi:hypothetical protein
LLLNYRAVAPLPPSAAAALLYVQVSRHTACHTSQI